MSDFSARLLRWQRAHGRHHLPWQGTREPYRVWLSEVMLQQTQVVTVIDYYQRFLARFPTVRALADAPLDEVLALWSGLGYYSRARNLHRCAQQVRDDWGGAFPRRASDLTQLAGIGPSTAAAIAAFCFDERISILDGNVLRVLARHLGEAADVSSTPGRRVFQAHAQALLPVQAGHMPAYTQALMDLGATLCKPRNPECGRCPLAHTCVALASERVQELPFKGSKLKRSSESWWLWLPLRSDGAVWLAQRPLRGVWAGLHAPQVFDSEAALIAQAQTLCAATTQAAPVVKHVLTHKDLYLHPVWQPLGVSQSRAFAPAAGAWYTPDQWSRIGLPAPVAKLLQQTQGLSSSR
jgi:A/G-specific adenine glycosylase